MNSYGDNLVHAIPPDLEILPEFENIQSQVLAWTNGQRILTHYLYSLVSKFNEASENSVQIDENTVNQIVKQIFSIRPHDISLIENREVKQYLQAIYSNLLDTDLSEDMLQRYGEILKNELDVPFSNSLIDRSLIQTQLVSRNRDGNLEVSNLILRKIFNLSWVENSIQKKKGRKILDKYHIALLAGLLSIALVSLGQYFIRYSPYRKLVQCHGNPIYKAAIDANSSLDEQKIEQSIQALKQLQNQDELPESCQTILYDLQYSQAIYLSAGIYNTPLRSVEVLCEIPSDYFEDKSVQPWFSRWVQLYQKTDFPIQLKQYLRSQPCPSQTELWRSPKSNESSLQSRSWMNFYL